MPKTELYIFQELKLLSLKQILYLIIKQSTNLKRESCYWHNSAVGNKAVRSDSMERENERQA
jgi:hypothetical protein